MADLYGDASSLLQGATKARGDLNTLDMENQKLADARNSEALKAVGTASEVGAKTYMNSQDNQQKTAEAEGAQTGANSRNQKEIDAQFITITPQLAKGAIGATGDNGWNDLIGQKMRVDAYSGLLTAAIHMSPKTLEIQEGKNVYTADYDPKTKQLRKIAGPGDKWSPDQMDGEKGGGGGQLNPFTLQNIVRNDEKTFLEQLGGKGAKGIPQQGEAGAFFSKLTNGYVGDLSDTEKAKLATLRSMAQRIKNNYTNLATLEESRGLQPSQPDPTVSDAIGKILSSGSDQAPQGAAGTKVKMISPEGIPGYLPADKVPEALKRGFKHG